MHMLFYLQLPEWASLVLIQRLGGGGWSLGEARTGRELDIVGSEEALLIRGVCLFTHSGCVKSRSWLRKWWKLTATAKFPTNLVTGIRRLYHDFMAPGRSLTSDKVAHPARNWYFES